MNETFKFLEELIFKTSIVSACAGFFYGLHIALTLVQLGFQPHTIYVIVTICYCHSKDYNEFFNKIDKVVEALKNNV